MRLDPQGRPITLPREGVGSEGRLGPSLPRGGLRPQSLGPPCPHPLCPCFLEAAPRHGAVAMGIVYWDLF